MTNTVKYILIALVVLVLYAIASDQDYRDQQMMQDHYCAMVQQHAWPDYKGIYNTACAKHAGGTRSVK